MSKTEREEAQDGEWRRELVVRRGAGIERRDTGRARRGVRRTEEEKSEVECGRVCLTY